MLAALALAYVVLSNLTPISESDFWLQLHTGDEIRSTGKIPRTIETAYTEARDLPFFAHEWLPSVLTSALFPLAGYAGMIVFKCALAVAIASLVALLARRAGADTDASLLIACAVATAMNFRLQMRPEIFAFLLALAALHLLVGFQRTRRWLWLAALVPLAVVWANAHGSFVIGCALPWVFLAGEAVDDLRRAEPLDADERRQRLRRVYVPLAAAGVAMAAASLANPYGFDLVRHTVAFSRARWLREQIVEFASTFGARTREAPYFWVFVGYASLVLAAVARGRRRLDGTSWVLLALFGWMAADAIRFTAWFALVTSYVLARTASGTAENPRRERRLAWWGATALALGIIVTMAHGDVRGHAIGFRDEAPMSPAAIAFVRSQSLSGNVFNTFSHGDQLVREFAPRIRVAIDSRIDAYGEAYYEKYLSLCGRSYKALGPPAELLAHLARYGVTTIVTRPLDFKNWQDKGHAEALDRAGWSLAYSDSTTLVLRRDRPLADRLPAETPAGAGGRPSLSLSSGLSVGFTLPAGGGTP